MFELNSSNALTVLRIFDGFNGQYPGGESPCGMVQATNRAFYGLTEGGGLEGAGIVFTLQAGLDPFVETIPESGKVGGAVNILGTGLTGATNVTFNCIPAKFEVASDSLITATVPQGATSGQVTVSTNRVLKSNSRFLVTLITGTDKGQDKFQKRVTDMNNVKVTNESTSIRPRSRASAAIAICALLLTVVSSAQSQQQTSRHAPLPPWLENHDPVQAAAIAAKNGRWATARRQGESCIEYRDAHLFDARGASTSFF